MRKVLLRDIKTKNDADQNNESENRNNNHSHNDNDNCNGSGNGNGNGNNDDNNDNYNHNNIASISAESQEDINDNSNSESYTYTSTKNKCKLSNPRNGEFHSILETVKDAVQKEAPKLIFSVCQALGSVGFVFLIEYARCEKSKISNCVLETNLSMNNNSNNCSNKIDNSLNDKFQYHNFVNNCNNDNESNVNDKEKKNGDNNINTTITNQSINMNNNLPVLDLMLNNQNRCQSCVSKITSILIAMLRHGAVKVRKKR